LADQDPSTAERKIAAPLGPGSAIILALVHLAVFVVVFTIGAGLQGEGARQGALVLNFGVAAVVAPLVALVVGLIRHAPDETFAGATRSLRPRGRGWLGFAMAVFAGVALAPALAAIDAAVLRLLPMPTGEGDGGEGAALGAGGLPAPGEWALFLVLAGVAAPVIEDLLYRGLIQSRLTVAWPRRVFAVALLFAAVQLNPRFAVAAFVLGLTLGFAADRAKTVWCSAAIHAAASTALLAAQIATDGAAPLLGVIGTLACLGVVVVLGWAFVRLSAPSDPDSSRRS
jgi:membrane protease YdiL (CAAX protease family)